MSENDGNIQIFLLRRNVNVSLLYVSYGHPFYGGNQMYVENKDVHIAVKGVPLIG